jgi:hypothetical protein
MKQVIENRNDGKSQGIELELFMAQICLGAGRSMLPTAL